VSANNDNSVLACVGNNTEIVIGANGKVITNSNSSYLFANLSVATGVTIDLTNLDCSGITDMSYMFRGSKLKNIPLPAGFGQTTTDMSNMFLNTSLPTTNFSLPAGFGSKAVSMITMFNWTTLNSDIDWSDTDLSLSVALKFNMFNNTTWNGHFIYVQNEGSKTFLITNSSISDNTRIKVKKPIDLIIKAEINDPTSFLGISGLNRDKITKISWQNTLPTCASATDVSANNDNSVLACVVNNTEIIIGADGKAKANSNSSWLFARLTSVNGVDIDLTNLDCSGITNMSHMFDGSELKNISLPMEFGLQVNDMTYMFNWTTLNGDIDWSGTDLGFAAAMKYNMFYNTIWNSHFIYALNNSSRNFLITNSDISDNTKIKIKNAGSPILKTEVTNPTNFLEIPGPNRDQITKISWQSALPTCASPTDVSANNDNSVLACVVNNTEIIIGANGRAITNSDSSYLFANLSITTGVDINLTNLDCSGITNMDYMFRNSKLKNITLPAGFGSKTTSMNAMFYFASLPTGFSLPAGFGGVATNMSRVFYGAVLPTTNFSLPAGFGSVATNMSFMFLGTELNSDIDWTNTDLTNYTAYNKSDMFNSTIWNGHFIYVQNEASRTFLITNTDINDNTRIKVKK
jgi:hypothetical protein